MIKARVTSTIGGKYTVYYNSHYLEVNPRGILRLKKVKLTIGDIVSINEKDLTLDSLEERKNLLIRPHVSNVDLGIVVTSLKTPDYSSFLLDKFLTLLLYCHIQPLIVLTKVDLATEKDSIQKIVNTYARIGIKVIAYSKRTGQGLEEIKSLILGKAVAFMGQTGVGKSSLINLIDPEFNRSIGEYSVALGRGKHQTKEVVFLPYQNGFIADTPGFSSLELPLYKEELALYFPGFQSLAMECKYSNCLHESENGCKIKEAVALGKIDVESYQNYLDMSKELILRKDRY